MSYSITNMGNSTKAQSQGSLKTLADMEQNREATNDKIDSQKKSSQMSGAMIGTQILPGWGTAIGAGVGFLAGSL